MVLRQRGAALAALLGAALCGLLQFMAVVEAAEPEAVAGHAARVALAALADAARLEAEVAQAERKAVESGVGSPLEVYEAIHPHLGLLLDACLASLRHAPVGAAPPAGAESAELGEIAALEEHIVGLLVVQAKEPLFFWHGPKRLALSRFWRLFNASGSAEGAQLGKSLRSRLEEAAAATPALSGPQVAGRLLGSQPSGATSELRASVGVVPRFGVVVDDSACGSSGSASAGQGSCDLAASLQAASSASAAGGPPGAHLLVMTTNTDGLKRISGELKKAAASDLKLFVSINVPTAFAESSPRQLFEMIKGLVHALGRKAVDLIWLPYAAFKKAAWEGVQAVVGHLIKEGAIRAYGIFSEARSKTLIKKLVDRSPKPAAWMTVHDMLRPATLEAVDVATGSGMTAVALPRAAGLPGDAAGLYMDAAFDGKGVSREAAQHRWTLDRGLALTLRLGGSDAPEELLRLLPDLRLERDASRVLEALGAATDSAKVAAGTPRPASGQWLLEAVQAWRAAAAALDRKVASESAEKVFPTISDSSLQTLDTQKQQYKENNFVIYKENFFDEETFAAISAEAKRLWSSSDFEGNCNLDGVDRLGGYVYDHFAKNSSLYQLIYGNEPFRQWVSAVNGEGTMWPADFPIEIREYTTKSRGMGCHSDLKMYNTARKDNEFAFTVDNDSKCNVTFWDAQGKKHEITTKANSMMMVRANAARHCVSSTVGGSRTILKFIYVGDYRKSEEFWSYTANVCENTNPNVVALERRRKELLSASGGSLEL